MLSVASKGSVLSIVSVGSCLSVGSIGSAATLFAAGGGRRRVRRSGGEFVRRAWEVVMVNRGLVAAASGFAGATTFGAFVSVRENIPGEPLGLNLPGRVPVHLRLGLGSGLSAPWPMPVAAMVAALRSGPGQPLPGRVCAAVGAIVLGGTVVEPATWGRRSRAPLVSAAVALNLISGIALMTAGRRASLAAGTISHPSQPPSPAAISRRPTSRRKSTTR